MAYKFNGIGIIQNVLSDYYTIKLELNNEKPENLKIFGD